MTESMKTKRLSEIMAMLMRIVEPPHVCQVSDELMAEIQRLIQEVGGITQGGAERMEAD